MLKIIATIISIVVLWNNTVGYCYPDFKDSLRLRSGQETTYGRIKEMQHLNRIVESLIEEYSNHEDIIDAPLIKATEEQDTPRLSSINSSNLRDNPMIVRMFSMFNDIGLSNLSNLLERLSKGGILQRFKPNRAEWVLINPDDKKKYLINGYASEDYITIREGLPEAREAAVLAHELLNYLKVKRKGEYFGPSLEIALEEALIQDTDAPIRPFLGDLRDIPSNISISDKKGLMFYMTGLIFSLSFVSFAIYRVCYTIYFGVNRVIVRIVNPNIAYSELSDVVEASHPSYYGAPLPFGLYEMINHSELLLHINHWWLNDAIWIPAALLASYLLKNQNYILDSSISKLKRKSFVTYNNADEQIKKEMKHSFRFIAITLIIIYWLEFIASVMAGFDWIEIIIYPISFLLAFLLLRYIMPFPAKSSFVSKRSVTSNPKLPKEVLAALPSLLREVRRTNSIKNDGKETKLDQLIETSLRTTGSAL